MFDTALVTKLVKDTRDSVLVSLKVANDKQTEYTYKQGQNLTLIHDIDGNELRRSYSICNSVNDAALRVGIKQVEGGKFSTWANNDLQVGDTIKLLPPSGHFFVELDPMQQKNYIGVAAGSGITPILSILKTTLESEPNSFFTLIYGNQSTDTIMFLEEIEDLKNKYPDKFRVFNVLSRELQNADLLNGRIDHIKINAFLNNLISAENVDDIFLCGPYEMVMSAKEAFVKSGVGPSKIHTELFGTPDALQAIAKSKNKNYLSEAERKLTSEVLVKIDGKGTKLQLARGGEPILDAALKIRKDLPFACKGGVCATCKARVIEGEVSMDLNYSLSEEEVDKGFILTCQAHPISETVVIDYDQK